MAQSITKSPAIRRGFLLFSDMNTTVFVGCASAMMRLAVTGMIIAIAIVAMATFR